MLEGWSDSINDVEECIGNIITQLMNINIMTFDKVCAFRREEGSRKLRDMGISLSSI